MTTHIGIISAVLSDEKDKIERHHLLWDDICATINYMLNNPKYKEIKLSIDRPIRWSDVAKPIEGGVTSDSPLQQT